jgi:hypothetical protein
VVIDRITSTSCTVYLTQFWTGTATDWQPKAPLRKGMPSRTTPELWRFHETLPVAELLASWEQKFRTLEWTVDPFNDEGGMMLKWDRATDVRFAS